MFSRCLLGCALVSLSAVAQPYPPDPFLHRVYDRLHDSPTQAAYRTLAPIIKALHYRRFTDAVTGEKLTPATIPVEGFGGRLVRAE